MNVPDGTHAAGAEPGSDDQRRLTYDRIDHAYPDWSPPAGGQRLAFYVHHSSTTRSIHTINADGTNPQRLTDEQTLDASPVWSPDGTQILFSRGDDVWVMDADGAEQGSANVQRLTDDPARDIMPAWRP
ncbi:MAG: DPP IV N-terminal domain-containing protein [Chloroflexi bacterium]|nr:DPP IV N-terminal domain-containing protein [Chloroflexota bacterium]MBU1750851.1 DPP IV N-terminal domain-containing protein [Chloroflexota bacterium]MBU1880217.1 DPP IV N-terminal domain-containing protein [Chloroflexota bacterium]